MDYRAVAIASNDSPNEMLSFSVCSHLNSSSLNSSSSLSALMGLPSCLKGAAVAMDQPCQPQCSLCVLECTLSELQYILSGMGIAENDLQVYQEVAREIVVVAKKRSQLQLSETVKFMQLLREFLVALNSIPGRLTAARQSGNCEVHRASRLDPNCWKKAPERAVSGLKRGTRHHFDGFCRASTLEQPSKKFKQLGHQLHNTETKIWPNENVGSDLNSQNSSGAECKCNSTDESSSWKDKSLCIDVMPSVDSEPGNEVWGTFTSAILSTSFGTVSDLRVVRCFLKRKQTDSAKTRVGVLCKTGAATGWESLSNDLQANVLQRVEFRDLFRFKILSKSCKKFVESETFSQSRGGITEGSFTAINYYIKHNAWQCSGFDLHSKSWRALPPFSYLPAPDAELFKEYSVCGHGGLMCADVSKLRKGELVVFNPLTGKTRALPPLLHPRNPVLVHISAGSAEKSYKVIVAGSTTSSQDPKKPNWKLVEVFDSSTSEWKETCNIPGPPFGLSKHQAGVCLNGIMFIILFLDGFRRRGVHVVALDVEKGKWLESMACPIPFSSHSNTLQLVENDGKVYLFSEQEGGGIAEHCIDELEFPNTNAGALDCQWRNVVRVRKAGGEGSPVYPELQGYVVDFTCVGFGEGKLCIFNTLNRDGVVYDMQDGMQCEVLEPPPADLKGDYFFSLNPASFTLQPSFDSDPSPKYL